MGPETLIFNLTVEELQEVVREAVMTTVDERFREKMPRATESGIRGLARIIGKSKTFAQHLKSKGVFDDAITQKARTITIDVVRAQELWLDYQNNEL